MINAWIVIIIVVIFLVLIGFTWRYFKTMEFTS